MKKLKLFENFNTDYLIQQFNSDILQGDNKIIINGFIMSYDNMSGTIEWFNDDYSIYATPYWNEDDEVPINVTNIHDDEKVLNMSVPLKKLEKIEDIIIAKQEYYNIIRDITKKLPEMISASKYNI
jgi:hypothetical protein